MNGCAREEVNFMNYSEIKWKKYKEAPENNKHIFYFNGHNNVTLYASCVYICAYLQVSKNLYLQVELAKC